MEQFAYIMRAKLIIKQDNPAAMPDHASMPIAGQPELEAYVDQHLKGSRLDRRAQAPEIYEMLLAKAVEMGVLKRV